MPNVLEKPRTPNNPAIGASAWQRLLVGISFFCAKGTGTPSRTTTISRPRSTPAPLVLALRVASILISKAANS
jgi:hypothetical protein